MNDVEQPAHANTPQLRHHTDRRIAGMGVLAVAALALAVWFVWGDAILATCFGRDVCRVEVPDQNLGTSLYEASDSPAPILPPPPRLPPIAEPSGPPEEGATPEAVIRYNSNE